MFVRLGGSIYQKFGQRNAAAYRDFLSVSRAVCSGVWVLAITLAFIRLTFLGPH